MSCFIKLGDSLLSSLSGKGSDLGSVESVEERGRLALSLRRSSRVVRDLYGYAATFEGRLFSNE